MNGRVSGIVVGGDCNFGLESTVIDMTMDIPMILRPGSVTKEQLEVEIGQVLIDPSLENKEDVLKAKAPGMKYTHYSPNGDVYIVTGKDDLVIEIGPGLGTLTKYLLEKAGKVLCIELDSKMISICFEIGSELNQYLPYIITTPFVISI